jgi:hypothetical protein
LRAAAPGPVLRRRHRPARAEADRGVAEHPLRSLDAFVDYAGSYQELGIDEIVVHWPVPDTIFANDLAVFERIATEGLAQLG